MTAVTELSFATFRNPNYVGLEWNGLCSQKVRGKMDFPPKRVRAGWQGGGRCKLPCASLQIAPVSETSLIHIFNNFIYLFVTVLSLH